MGSDTTFNPGIVAAVVLTLYLKYQPEALVIHRKNGGVGGGGGGLGRRCPGATFLYMPTAPQPAVSWSASASADNCLVDGSAG